MIAKRILSKPKPAVLEPDPAAPLVKRVLGKPKISSESTPALVPLVKRVLGKPKIPVPPRPIPNAPLTKVEEAFESLREYYAMRNLPIPQADIKWYLDELILEKKEFDEFWSRCAATKACIEGTLRGDDDWTISLAVNAARQAEKKLPILESDIGPMPAYGTGEFWAWCSKRKKLKSQKEEAMIAAGIPVPLAKKKTKVPKAQNPLA